jgi:uncharacterized protein
MIERNLFPIVINKLKAFPSVAMLGARQVGKTTLAKLLQAQFPASLYLDLELDSDINKLDNAELFLETHENKLIIIDEIQRKPNIFPLLRALIDKKNINGRFLLLGSASGKLLKQSSESLAGRIIYCELNPFSCLEVFTKSIQKLWIQGGFPKSFLEKDTSLSIEWRQSMIQTYLERDIPQLGIQIPTLRLKRFLQMIAHVHGQLWNASMIAQNLGISTQSVNYYLDILEETFILRRLTPYFTNIKKRLIKSPKIYIRDSGILHALMNITSYDEISSSPFIGNSWEGFVIEQLINNAPKKYEAVFFRTVAGAEIDLVFLKAGVPCIAIEIKYSLTPKVSQGFWNALTDIQCNKAYIVYPGKDSYLMKKNLEVIPLAHIDKIFHEENINSSTSLSIKS